MNLLKRLKNIWRLSELEIPDIGEKPQTGDTVIGELFKKKPMGYVVRTQDPLDKLIQK